MVEKESRVKVGSKGEIILPEEFKKRVGIKPRMNVLIGLKDHKVYIESKKKDPAKVFKEIAESKPPARKLSVDKSYEEEIEERWNKLKK